MMKKRKKPAKSLLTYLFGGAAILAAAVFLDAIFLEKFFFRIKEIRIGDRKNGRPVSLVLVTDLHLKKFLPPHHRRLAATLNRMKPDMLLIAGDTLDTFGKLKTVDAFFALLNPDYKKVAIPGNHDHKAIESNGSLKCLADIYKKHRCDFLINQTKIYTLQGAAIAITGLDDFIEGNSNLRAAVANTGQEHNHILLLHSPLQQEKVLAELKQLNSERKETDKLKIQYIFAGHNHGGQVKLPGFVPVLPEKSGDYVQGWYNSEPPYLFLSKGFGTSAVPFRFFSRSEIIHFSYYAV